jgi:uncharacterized protein YidB (DUF937 family)
MDVIEMGVNLLTEKLGLNLDPGTVKSALSGLLGDGQGGIDLAGLSQQMLSNDGLATIVGSWLGDGANDGIDASQILGLLGENRVADFASQLGTDSGSAAEGLAQVIPQMMDQSSAGGELLSSMGGVGGLLGAAKSFLT